MKNTTPNKSPVGRFRGLLAFVAFIIIHSALNTNEASAQSFQWATAAGSKNINTKADMPVDLATDANGNSYLLSQIHAKEIYVGSTAIADGKGYEAGTLTMLSSLDKNGKYRWSKVIGAAATAPKEVKVMNDKVYMMGAVASAPGYKAFYDADFTSPEYISNLSLTCYDTSGVFKWVARPDTIIDDTKPYRPISFDIDDAGNSYMLVTMPAGSKIMGSSMTIPSTTPYIGYGLYVLKYSPTGALVSVTMLKDICYAKGTQGGVDRFRFTLNKKTKEYYVYGVGIVNSNSDTLYVKSSIMKKGLYFASFAEDGTYNWDIRDDKENVANVAIRRAYNDALGNIIIGGSGSKDVTFNGYTFTNTLSAAPSPGIPFIMKMSNTGSLIWCKSGGSFGGSTNFCLISSFSVNPKIAAISGISGKSFFFGETKDSIFVNNSGQDGWFAIVDINSGKTLKMGAARGDGFYDAIRAISFSGDDLYIGGNFENTKMIFDSSAVSVGPAKSGTDLFVAKMSTSGLVSVEEKSANLVNIKIYPNPANDVLYIDQLQDETEIRLLALNGQQVYSGISTGSLHQINVASLTPGIYVLQLRDKAGELYNAKLLKQ